ncbi:protease, partial [Streptomyces sp. JHD 1]|nr:protease [Streptomyces sp. JHD 1]
MRPVRISLLAVTTAALLGSGITASVAAPAAPAATPADTAPAAAAERLIVGYKTQAAEAASDSAAGKDARKKGEKSG